MKTKNLEPSTPCLLCGQPVTKKMWQAFTPCPKSKDGKSGHMLACTPDSLGKILVKKRKDRSQKAWDKIEGDLSTKHNMDFDPKRISKR